MDRVGPPNSPGPAGPDHGPTDKTTQRAFARAMQDMPQAAGLGAPDQPDPAILFSARRKISAQPFGSLPPNLDAGRKLLIGPDHSIKPNPDNRP